MKRLRRRLEIRWLAIRVRLLWSRVFFYGVIFSALDSVYSELRLQCIGSANLKIKPLARLFVCCTKATVQGMHWAKNGISRQSKAISSVSARLDHLEVGNG